MDEIIVWLKSVLLSDNALMTLAVVPILIVWERLQPAKHAPLSHYWFGAKYWVANLVVLTVLSPLINISLARIIRGVGLGLIDLSRYGIPGFGGVLIALFISTFVADFFFYWFHRTLHVNPILWQTHLLHHTDEHMNALTAQRGHFTETLLSPIFIAIPMAILFKIPPITVGILSLLPYAYLFFAHANIRVNFGALWWVIISPDYHRIHHSIELKHRDKNFTNWFPIWDVLFGTAYLPEKDERPETGVDGVEVRTLTAAFLLPFVGWWKMYRERSTRRQG